jgi:hypothetical protein
MAGRQEGYMGGERTLGWGRTTLTDHRRQLQMETPLRGEHREARITPAAEGRGEGEGEPRLA